MPIFFGEHDLSIDEKNRLLIPAQIRKRIVPETDGKSFFVTLKDRKSYGCIPWFYPEAFFMNLVNKGSPPVLEPTEEQLEFTYGTLATADELEWDNQGRVVLSEKILTRARLGKEVTLVGMKEHLELWNRATWAKFRDGKFKMEDTGHASEISSPASTGTSGEQKQNGSRDKSEPQNGTDRGQR